MREEITSLIKKSKEGCEISFEEVLRELKPLIYYVSKGFNRFGVDIDDLVSEGNIAVILGVREIDFGKLKRISLVTYFRKRISFRMKDYLRDDHNLIRIPRSAEYEKFEISSSDYVLDGLESHKYKSYDMDLMENIIQTLTKREQYVIRAYSSFVETRDISKSINTGEERVRQIRKEALKKMKEIWVMRNE